MRSTTRLTVIAASRFRWACAHESLVSKVSGREFVEDGARTRELLRPLANHPPFGVVLLFADLDELIEFAFRLQFDLQLSDVKVFGVIKFSEQDRVHQFGDSFRYLSRIAFLSDLEENNLGGKSGGDGVKEIVYPLVVDLLLEEVCERVAQHLTVLECVSEVLGERAFPRTEEARRPRRQFLRVDRRALRQSP